MTKGIYERRTETKEKLSISAKRRIQKYGLPKGTWRKGHKSLCGMLGKYHTEETRHKMSLAAKGKPKSLEHRKKMSIARKNYWLRYPERKQVMSQKHKGKTFSSTSRRLLSEALRGRHNSPQTEFTHERMSGINNTFYGRKHTSETKAKILAKLLIKLHDRPTSLERQFIDICAKHNLPYRYVGDGSFIIDGKNPDFINVNGEKVCIEVANYYHHKPPWAENRIKHFKKWGWRCVIFFEDELDEQHILQTLPGL